MKTGSRSLLLLLAFCLAVPLNAQSISSCNKTLGVAWQDIVDCMDALTSTDPYDDQLRGAVFGYVPPGQTTAVVAAAGNLETSSILSMGSMAKPFTHTAALLAMWNMGWRMDKRFVDIPDVRPYLINTDTDPASRAAKETLTLKQLLSMSAGFQEWPRKKLNDTGFYNQFVAPVGEQADACFARTFGTTDQRYQWVGRPGLDDDCVFVPTNPGDNNSPRVWKNVRRVPIAQAAPFVMGYPIPAPALPGGRQPHVYTALGSVFAAWIAEVGTAQKFNNHLRNEIFIPLGMSDTFYDPLNEAGPSQRDRIAHVENMANGLRDTQSGPPGITPCNGSYWCDQRDWLYLWPEAGLYSTAGNMLTFMQRLRDDAIPALQRVILAADPSQNRTIRQLLLEDQLDGDQSGNSSRTAGFAYARGGEGVSEGSVYHGGVWGTRMTLDRRRGLVSFFGTQRLMRRAVPSYPGAAPAPTYSQEGAESLAEARLFETMLNAMVENVKPENLNFFFDAARALKRNQRTLRYASRVPGQPFQDAHLGCRNSSTACEYQIQVDYNTCWSPNPDTWYDLSPNQRVMNLSGTCAWGGSGSVSENAAFTQYGPYRLRTGPAGQFNVGQVSSNLYPNQYTIALWVRPSSANAASIFARSGSRITHQVGIQNGRFIHSSWDTSGIKRTIVGDPVVANRWYYVVATAVRNGPMTLWINGLRVPGNVTIGDFVSLGSPQYLIGDTADGLPRFQGDLAVIALYTQAHGQADILRNCNGLKYRFPDELTCG